MEQEKKFVCSYSGGKDGALALYRAVKMGYTPAALLTTYRAEKGRSWFHGIPAPLLEQAARSMGIALQLVQTEAGCGYGRDLEQALTQCRTQGAEYCVFGDIDIQDHYDWCNARCCAVGMQSLFPLWNEPREKLVYELIDSGFRAVITIVDTTRLSERFLGQTLTRKLAQEIAAEGADICGENGEYHTFVYDGPLFSAPVDFQFGEKIMQGNYAVLPVLPVSG